MKYVLPRVAALLTAALVVRPVAQQPAYDLLLRNGRVVDGMGTPWFRGDVGIRGDRVVAVGPAIAGSATRVIDVNGLVIAPGFIDIHSHARRTIFEVPAAESYIRQGVTTAIEGPDGSSPVPLAAFFDKLDALPKSINIGSFIGHGSIRSRVMGDVNRPASPDDLQRMRAMTEQGMRDGAFGLSSGLFYVPGAFAPTSEVVELARVAARFGGIHISHMRNEAGRILESVQETIAIGEQGGLPTQVTHHKIIGRAQWGKSLDTLRLIDEARARGVDATIDQYPYTASATGLESALLPAWVLEGTSEEVRARLRDREVQLKIRPEVARTIREERGGGDPKNIVLSSCTWDRSLAGKSMADVMKLRGLGQTMEDAADAVLWVLAQGSCRGIFHAINEDDLQRILKHPATMVASDGDMPVFGRDHPHPRSYGTFSRVLGVYVREKRILSLEESIRKMSAFPAQRIGLADRGILRPGVKADIAVLDPAAVRDAATFEQPHQYAEGVLFVVVNGQLVLDEGRMTTARPGRVLKKHDGHGGPSNRD